MGYFDALMRYFELGGRTSRSQYWTYQLIVVLVAIAAAFADAGAIRSGLEQGHFGLFLTFVAIFHFVPSITTAVRRLHDINKSGMWYLICFVPFGAFVLLFWACRRGDDSDNFYGDADGGGGFAAPSSRGDGGYQPPAGRLVRMGNTAPRAAATLDTPTVSTTRFI